MFRISRERHISWFMHAILGIRTVNNVWNRLITLANPFPPLHSIGTDESLHMPPVTIGIRYNFSMILTLFISRFHFRDTNTIDKIKRTKSFCIPFKKRTLNPELHWRNDNTDQAVMPSTESLVESLYFARIKMSFIYTSARRYWTWRWQLSRDQSAIVNRSIPDQQSIVQSPTAS